MEGTYGIISVIPLLVMLVLVIWTKRIFESILVSITVALLISEGIGNLIFAFTDQIYVMLADETYSWILVILLLFGALIKLLVESGGTLGFGKFAEKYIKNEKSSLFATWILGIVIFIDDYLNNLTIGAAMRGITDKYKTPREMVAMVINATGGPVCVLVPFSTWAAFIYGLMLETGVAEGGLVEEYVKVIPFIFFAIVMVAMVPFITSGIIPKVGPLKKAYERSHKEGGSTFPLDLAETVGEEFMEDEQRIRAKGEPKLRDFLLPVAAVIGFTVYTQDLVLGLIVALIVAFVIYIPTKKMTITEFFDFIFEGIKDMVFLAVFIMMAFVFVESVNTLGFTEYMISKVEPYLIGGLIPVVTFVTIAVMTFFGIDFWGVMILTFPIIVPLSNVAGMNVHLSLGAIISGAVFGGMSCFFSEQMLMSSTSCQIRPTDQAVCLFPYAIAAGVITALLYLVFGFAL